MIRVIVAADAEALYRSAADLALGKIREALEARGKAIVVLSGGRTPRGLFRLLALDVPRLGIPPEKLLWIFADERWVPVSHQESNEGAARRMLLGPIGAPERTILSWNAGSGDPIERGSGYAEAIRTAAGADTAPDMTLLGIGADGHTASLFPGAVLMLPGGRSVPAGPDIPADSAAVQLSGGEWRLTLCPRYLNRSLTAVFLAADPAKRESLRRASKGNPDTPASWVRGCDTLFMTTRDTVGDGPVDYGGARFA